MWAKYASSHCGLVIEFRQTYELFSLPFFFEIEYSDDPAVFDASIPADGDNAKSFLRRKQLRWSSERESRLMLELAVARSYDLPQGRRYFIGIGPEAVVSVTLGLHATDQTQKDVIKLLGAPPLTNIPLFQIRKNTEAGMFEREAV
jgi:hypothetical protein